MIDLTKIEGITILEKEYTTVNLQHDIHQVQSLLSDVLEADAEHLAQTGKAHLPRELRDKLEAVVDISDKMMQYGLKQGDEELDQMDEAIARGEY